MKVSDILQKYFGYSSFRNNQLEIIKRICNEKKDTVVLMATGGGKSLCYQIPGLFFDLYAKSSGRKTVVISPLLSLMQDQVANLQKNNISAVYLGSSQSDIKAEEDAINGKYTFIYLTPEKAVSWKQGLNTLEKNCGISLFAIDETHCVSEWGNDFRPEYRQLSFFKKNFPNIPVLALTATATDLVVKDIIRNLNLIDVKIFKTSYNRTNLSYYVKSKSVPELDIIPMLQQVTSGMTIVYCLTKRETENLSNLINRHGISCEAYHAGKDNDVKKEIYDKFRNNKVQCLVCTIAFGMGIDKPDIRRIIHYGPTKSLETYYQQSGRAGRDGLMADCILFYKDADFVRLSKIIQYEKNSKFLLQSMKNYVKHDGCLRKKILEYFNDNSIISCECKICSGFSDDESSTNSNFISVDLDTLKPSKELYIAVKAILFTGCRYGITIPVLLIMGSKNAKLKKVLENGDTYLYGIGKHRNITFWKSIIENGISMGFLKKSNSDLYPIIEVTTKGHYFISTYDN